MHCRQLVTATWAAATVLAAAAIAIPASLIAQQPAGQQPAAGVKLTLLDGQAVSTPAIAVAGGKVTGEGLPTGLTLDDLRRIDLPGPSPAAEKPPLVVELRGGGLVAGRSVTIGDDKCVVEWSLGEKLSLPIDVVRAVRFAPATANPEFDKVLAAPAADADRIFFKVDDKFDSIAGLIVSLTAEQLTFQFEGAERTLPRSQLFGIVVAQAAAEDDPTRCLVWLRDGSRLAGDLTSVEGKQALLALPGGGQVAFPWSAAAKVDVRSSRVAFLSNLKPTSVEEGAVVTITRPWQRDKNVMGRPLVLASQTFDKGIGVHARSSLTFAAGGKYDTLAAVIGIDAGTGGKGDCVFTVLGDGQPLFTKRVKGNEPPQEISVEIARVREVTLLVEPGADLDLADHANWCEVRLIKAK
jgi:hypothetical protein